MQPIPKRIYSDFLHTLLFLLTFFTATLAGVQWLNKDPFELANFWLGLPYSLSLLAILAAHEFGHFFAAKYHQVETTLPYFIPVPHFLVNPFGTMGAVIRIRSRIHSRVALFDIGIAGPIAGLIITLVILLYGFMTLPGMEYLFSIHPEYTQRGNIPQLGLTFGNSLLFWGLLTFFSTNNFVPPMNEVYHYPYLCAGWFGLFVTALNLLPVGQLDGGHILYSLVGKKQVLIARGVFVVLIAIGISSFIPGIGWYLQSGSLGWLLWAVILFFVIKLDHPEIPDDTPLDAHRRLLGWLAFAIFLATFPPIPFFEFLPR